MEQKLKKYLIFIEHRCPLLVWGNLAREDEWRIYEANEPPYIGLRLNDGCGGGMHPYQSCDEEDTRCEERGIITKIEGYSQQKALELGLEEHCK